MVDGERGIVAERLIAGDRERAREGEPRGLLVRREEFLCRCGGLRGGGFEGGDLLRAEVAAVVEAGELEVGGCLVGCVGDVGLPVLLGGGEVQRLFVDVGAQGEEFGSGCGDD